MDNTFKQLYKKLDSKLKSIKSLSLTTADGFSIFSETGDGFKVEDDKLSAVTSSLTALSNAAAKQLMKSNFQSTYIETTKGLMYMIQTRYKGKTCILCLISGENPNLGQIRFYLNNLAKYLETASLSAE